MSFIAATAARGQPEAGDPAGEDDWAAAVEALLTAIEAEERQSGPPSEALGRQLQALGRLYHDRSQFDLAAVSFGRALEIARMQSGFTSMDHVTLLWDIAVNEENRGNFDSVQQVEERLSRLAVANPDDGRSIDVLERVADRQVAAFVRFLEQGTPFNVAVNEHVESTYRVNLLFDEKAAALAEIARARVNYGLAADAVRDRSVGDSARVEALEIKLVRTYLLEASLRNAMLPQTAYELGQSSYRRILEYKAAFADPPYSIARTLVELADWHLIFDHYGPAEDRYLEAYDTLVATPDGERRLDALFAPEVPVLLPAFIANPLVAASRADGSAYLAVEIAINRFGRADVEAIATNDDARLNALETRAERWLRRRRFRPALVDGALAARAPSSVLYSIEAAAALDDAELR